MRIGILTREWPPEIYGGAGVHVEYLTRSLRTLVDVDVHSFGGDGATVHAPDPGLAQANAALRTLSVDLRMAAAVGGCDVLHSHTWYADLAGHLGAMLHDVPHVVTTHSLEPHRPWKAEQLGGGYRISSWAEKAALHDAAAVIAVSNGMAASILDAYPGLDPGRIHVVHNGIDTSEYRPVPSTGVLERLGIDESQPLAIFIGRITRQKGVEALLRSAATWPGQLLLCASSPDTPELGTAVSGLVADLQATRPGVVWVSEMLPRHELIECLSLATVFVCPSIYEPLGIVNLEAMACGTAVVASRVGGIPEVVDDGVSGHLVDLGDGYDERLAAAVVPLLSDPARAADLGRAGRERAVADFGWDAIAARTVEVYRAVL
ncbi:MAG: putative glycogen synthase, ADP-glucose transglucosylase, Actinobacterial type [Frankiales bacterium]|nr:putative glycogen synthase, ADP-glucose transglucosylase, Actinobacterial type [Frankiales bacterium]